MKHNKPAVREMRLWPWEALLALQDCFEITQWEIFKEAAMQDGTTDLQECTESITGYINKCMDDVTQ